MYKISLTLNLLFLFTYFILSLSLEDKWFGQRIDEKDDEEVEAIENFKTLDNDLKVVEVKRKLMQALGGVNDVYDKTRVHGVHIKGQLLTLLRRLQTSPVNPTEAKVVLKSVADSLQKIVKTMETDPKLQRLSVGNLKEMLYGPVKALRMVFTLISIW